MLKRFFCLAALTLLALFTWWVLWFMVMGALTGEGELLATIGPALQSEEEQGAVWCLLPSWPTPQPLVQLLLDTPGFFAMFWNACKLVFPQGAGPLRCFFSVGLPLGLPAILSAATLGFIEAWNAIEQPMMFLQDKSNWPLSLYLSNITVEDLGLAMVASLMMLAPPLLLFMVGRKYLEGGIGLSAQTNDGM